MNGDFFNDFELKRGKGFLVFFFWIITKFKDFENRNEGRKTKLKRLII
jgi:hypothetical protein